VALRWIGMEDAADLYRIFSDPEVMKYWSSPPMTQSEEAEALVEGIHRGFAAHSLYEWGIVRKEDGRLIGTFTLWHLDERNRRAEIGFALARDVWGHGYMREALTAAFDFAFGPMDLSRLEADVDPDNAVSLGLLERLGFRREGLLRERWHVGGQVLDSVILGLLRRDWNARDTVRE
jgi:RimJ/RimL family protein N-acetyltransferase